MKIPALSVEKLSFWYHEKKVLHDISFQINPGERVGVVGRNGAGKSTLLLHLNGLLRSTGNVYVNGVKIEKKSLASIRSQVGFVFSDTEDQLFMPTIIEDAAFGPLNMGLSLEEAYEKADSALARMRLTHLRNSTPHHLSDGERRRAAIATVLSMNPSIWVLDEPGANLDCQSRRELITLLRSLNGTVILASHDLDLVLQVCDRILIIEAGKLIADGKVKEVLSDENLMKPCGLEVPLRLQIENASVHYEEKAL